MLSFRQKTGLLGIILLSPLWYAIYLHGMSIILFTAHAAIVLLGLLWAPLAVMACIIGAIILMIVIDPAWWTDSDS